MASTDSKTTRRNRIALSWIIVFLPLSVVFTVIIDSLLQKQLEFSMLAGINIVLILIIAFLLYKLSKKDTSISEASDGSVKNQDLIRRLEESEERYRTLFENLLSPVIIYQDFHIRYANQLFYQLSGYTPEEVLNEDFDVTSLIHEDDRPAVMGDILSIFNDEHDGKPREIRYIKKSGEVIVGLTVSSLVHIDGKPAIEAAMIDITQQKEIESELGRTEQRLQYLLDTAPVMIFQLDKNGHFLYSNAETERVTGHLLEEWEGKSFAPIVHPDDLPIALAKFEEGRKGSERREYSLRIINSRDEERLLRVNAKTIYENGEFAGSLIIAGDITEQEHMKEQLERDKSFIDQLIENANALIAVTNEEGKLVIFNRRFEEATGFTKDEALGKNPFDVYALQESYETTMEHVAEIRKGKSFPHLEVPIATKDGRRLLVTWSAAAIKLPSGADGIVIVGKDVTDQKRMHEELIQSKKLASIGELVAGVAHELNNPLTVVIGYSQLLTAEEALIEKHHEMSQKVLDAAVRSKRIVENLLAFSRKKKLEKGEVDINDLMENTLSLREHSFEVNNIKIMRSYDNNIPPTVADGYQLQQVFLNLINNAFDAMREDYEGGVLNVKTYRENGMLILEVADDGPGVSEDLQEKIFDPFFTTKEVGKGTGLGMSLSYGIVKEHGGAIYLDKSYQDGAKFVIELPLTPDPFSDTERNP